MQRLAFVILHNSVFNRYLATIFHLHEFCIFNSITERNLLETASALSPDMESHVTLYRMVNKFMENFVSITSDLNDMRLFTIADGVLSSSALPC